MQPAYSVFAGGSDRQGSEAMGQELGVMTESRIPEFLVKLGQTISSAHQDYPTWIQNHPDLLPQIAQQFLT